MSILGRVFAGSIATALLTICLFIVTKWDRTRVKRGAYWRKALRIPRFNYWNIFWIVITILFCQAALGALAATVSLQIGTSKDCISIEECMAGTLTDRKALAISWAGAAVSYFTGGYIAQRLPNYKCPSPYRHALFAAFLAISLNVPLTIWLLISRIDGLSEEDPGFAILASVPWKSRTPSNSCFLKVHSRSRASKLVTVSTRRHACG